MREAGGGGAMVNSAPTLVAAPAALETTTE
jgi:hypothetical protein